MRMIFKYDTDKC